MIEIGTWSIIGFFTTIGVGWVTPTSVESYIGLNYSPFDQNMIEFKEPFGYYGLQTNIHKNVRLFVEHQSSPMQGNDHPGFNHAGVKFLAPLSPSITAYTGLSANSEFDNKRVKTGTLVSIGAESGGQDIKLFTEYIAPTYDLDGGRFAVGVKAFFR